MRICFLAAVFAYLSVNATFSLAPTKLVEQLPFKLFKPGILSLAEQEGSGASLLFSANYSPLQRKDETQMRSLIETLRKISLERKEKNLKTAIYVAATSNVLEGDILKNAERKFYNITKSTLDIPLVTNVDTRDSYPVEGLIHADLVLVAEPTQVAIPIYFQQVIDLANKCFLESWEFSKAFKRLDNSFTLDNGVKVSLFERQYPSTYQDATLLLSRFKASIKLYPGGQPDWISTGEPSNYRGERDRKDFVFDMKNSLSTSTMEHYLLYVPEFLRLEPLKVKGKVIASNAKNLYISLVCLDEKRKENGKALIQEFKESNGGDFTFYPKVNDTYYLVLKISAEPQNKSTCQIKITNLELSKTE